MSFRRKLLAFAVLIIPLFLSGCAVAPPSNQSNVCRIFEEYPDWYQDGLQMQKEWGTPIPVAMAIIKQESSFRSAARPPKKYVFFGMMPWGRVTSAYGYAQAANAAWEGYQQATGNGGSRTSFDDALMFIGWYTSVTQQKLGISKTNAYAQYLAYHEGWGGYQHGSYLRKPFLLKIARRVQENANAFTWQLRQCQAQLNQNKSWWSML
jgi:hypothetical protein